MTRRMPRKRSTRDPRPQEHRARPLAYSRNGTHTTASVVLGRPRPGQLQRLRRSPMPRGSVYIICTSCPCVPRARRVARDLAAALILSHTHACNHAARSCPCAALPDVIASGVGSSRGQRRQRAPLAIGGITSDASASAAHPAAPSQSPPCRQTCRMPSPAAQSQRKLLVHRRRPSRGGRGPPRRAASLWRAHTRICCQRRRRAREFLWTVRRGTIME